MTILRILLSIIGITGVTWFSLPFISNRILNIGNASGICIFLLIFVYGIFFKKLNHLIASIWKYIGGKIVLSLILAFISICFVIVITESFLIIKANSTTPENGATVIVLGCKVRGDKASLMLRERLDAAYEFLINNPDSACVLSGGKGEGENISEARCMYDYLIEKGISQDRLYMEDKSTSTRENLSYSKEIIDSNNLNPDIAIATNEFHMYRASQIAKNLELNSTSISADTAWWLFPTYYFRELYGIMYQWFL